MPTTAKRGPSLNIQILTVAFGVITAAAAAWLLFRIWRALPARLDARCDREVAERLHLMAALADGLANADGAQRERLAANYRFHRAAVQALRPGTDTSVTDARFAPSPAPRRLAA